MTAAELRTACQEGRLDAVRGLLAADAAVQDGYLHFSPKDLEQALADAIRDHQYDIMAMLLAHGAPVTSLSFLAASRIGDVRLWQVFVESGWDINSLIEGNTALSLSVDQPACARWLLAHGADATIFGEGGRPPLVRAAGIRELSDVPALLIAGGAQPDFQVLHSAVHNRGPAAAEILSLLIKHGVDVNGVRYKATGCTWGGTPLHVVSTLGLVPSIRVLLAAGADPTALYCGLRPSALVKGKMRPGREYLQEAYDLLLQAEAEWEKDHAEAEPS